MKKLFLFILILSLILSSHRSFAQSTYIDNPCVNGEIDPLSEQYKELCTPADSGGYSGRISPPTTQSSSATTPPVGTQHINTIQPSITVPTGAVGGSSTANTCSAVQFKSLIDILIWLKCLISSVFIPLIFALAFVFFLWGVIRFMLASDNAKKAESKKYIWYGLVGLFIMVSVWGIITLAGSVFGFDTGIPYLPTHYLTTQSTTGK